MYESEFEELLELKLKEMFGDLYDEYIFKRYLIIYKIKTYKDVKFSHFAMYIAKLISARIIDSSYFLYKDTKFYIASSVDQSVENILINWPLFATFKLKYSKSRLDKIVLESQSIIDSIWKKVRPKRVLQLQKEYLYLSEALVVLNNQYNIVSKKVFIEGVEIEENEFTSRTLEEVAEIYIKDLKFSTCNNQLVSEKDIEEFIQKKFSREYPEYSFTRQVVISEGNIVDIYAKSIKNQEIHIIEIKNKKDDRLYWQVIKYKTASPTAKVVVMAPEYDSLMITKLKSLDYVTVVKFKVLIEMGRINDISFYVL